MPSSPRSLELTQIDSPTAGSISAEDTTTWEHPTNAEVEQPPLPPADTGKAAWLVLAGCVSRSISIRTQNIAKHSLTIAGAV